MLVTAYSVFKSDIFATNTINPEYSFNLANAAVNSLYPIVFL